MLLGVRNQREPVWDAGGTSRLGKGIEGMRSSIACARPATSEIRGSPRKRVYPLVVDMCVLASLGQWHCEQANLWAGSCAETIRKYMFLL